MFFVFAVYRYSVMQVVVKAVIVSLLDHFVFLELSEKVGGWFVVNDVDGIVCHPQC